MYLRFVLILFTIQNSLFSQVMDYQSFIAIVKNHHPISKQANLVVEEGEFSIMSAKGAFDPSIYTQLGQKYFKGEQYYSDLSSGIKFPTWVGADFYAGFENTRGEFINPELNTPEGGLAFAGVSVPIGQGLFIDKRRADLRKAKIFQQMTLEEQKIILNDLFLEASKVYWEWFESYNALQVYQNTIELAKDRLEAVKSSSLLGDNPYIDTVEATIQVQTLELSLMESELQFKNASAWISVFLWADGVVPVELEESVVPPLVSNVNTINVDPSLLLSRDSLSNNHPQVLLARYKINQLEVEKAYRRELLKPELNLKYNAINEPIGFNPFASYSISNYTWGMDFYIPLFLRRERGNYKIAGIRLQEAEYDLPLKQQEINNKVIMALNQWETTYQQAELFKETVVNLRRLLDGERTRFDTGESSLFLVNSREIIYVNANIKLLKLMKDNQLSRVKTYYSMGVLFQNQ